MGARFEIKKSDSGKFSFNLKAGNGEVILTSQIYADKGGAMNGIAAVKNNTKSEEGFELLEAKNGLPYFVLSAGNKEIIGRSELYSSKSAMKNGIKSVMRNAAVAEIVDLTGN